MTPNTHLPTLCLNGESWELILPANVLPPMIANITMSEDGIYIETLHGEYDLISYGDLKEIMVPNRAAYLPGRNELSGWPAPTFYFVDDSPPAIPIQ